MPYVYILSDYGEHGAEHVCATLDRSKLVGMVRTNFASAMAENEADYNERWVADGVAGLEQLLLCCDAELATGEAWNCHHGWGGMQLHVVQLQD